ncbi:unnamed protein product, partial [Mesorhabditis spiculigera]
MAPKPGEGHDEPGISGTEASEKTMSYEMGLLEQCYKIERTNNRQPTGSRQPNDSRKPTDRADFLEELKQKCVHRCRENWHENGLSEAECETLERKLEKEIVELEKRVAEVSKVEASQTTAEEDYRTLLEAQARFKAKMLDGLFGCTRQEDQRGFLRIYSGLLGNHTSNNSFILDAPSHQSFIKKLAKVQSYIETWSQDIYATKDYLGLGMKVADFLNNNAPQIGASTVQVIREASILFAVNKTLEVFVQKIKNTTYEAFHHDCGTAEKEGLEKVHKMVKASDFEEAAALFREKSKEIATGKFYELKAAEDERLGQQISGQFLSSEMEKITSNFIVARYEQMRNLQLNFVVANADRDMRIEMEKEVLCGVEIQPAAANAQRHATSNLQNALEQLGFEPGTVVKIREKTAEHLENTAQSLAERFVADRESKSKLEKLQADYQAHTKREIALAMEAGQRPDEESDVESDITEIERYEDLLEDPQTQYHPDISALPSQAWHVQPSPPSAYAPPSNPEPQGSRQKTTPINNYGTLGPAIENSIPQKHDFLSRAQELEEARRHSIDPLQAGRDEMWRELAILKHCYEKGDVRDEATAKYLSDQCLKRCNAFWNLKGYEGMDLLALEGELEAAIVRLEQRPAANVAATRSSYNRSSIIATVLAMLVSFWGVRALKKWSLRMIPSKIRLWLQWL